jgi:hypothetical protein
MDTGVTEFVTVQLQQEGNGPVFVVHPPHLAGMEVLPHAAVSSQAMSASTGGAAPS